MQRREIRWWWCPVPGHGYHRWKSKHRTAEGMKIGDYIPDARLGEGESIEGLFDPQVDIPEEKGTLGGTVYTVLLQGAAGKPVAIKGGKSLMNGVSKASLSAPGKTLKLRITAHGEARTTARTYEVKVVR